MKHSANLIQDHLFSDLTRVPLQLLLWAVISLGFAQNVAAQGDGMPLPGPAVTESMVLHASPQANVGQLALAGGALTAHPPDGPCAGQMGHPCAGHPPDGPCAGQAGHRCAAHPPGGPCAVHGGHPCSS